MSDLAHVLRQLPENRDPHLLVGNELGDDAAIYRVNDNLALVQTVDFFTPIVDDPYTYGQIAAANSLSDVYAVGGEPITAMNIAAFPVKTLSTAILAEILRGGADKAREAGVAIVGGHTVDDEEPKYGLSVLGTVHPEKFLSGRKGKIGDTILLTKPVGTGIVATALKAGKVKSADLTQAVRWMSMLNRDASRAMLAAGAHACTDLTGFGLLGHLSELCKSSGVAARISASSIPLLPGALGYTRDGFVPGGASTNAAAIEELVEWEPGPDEALRLLLFDPQTSGGLIVCLAPEDVTAFRNALGSQAIAPEIGRLIPGTSGNISVSA